MREEDEMKRTHVSRPAALLRSLALAALIVSLFGLLLQAGPAHAVEGFVEGAYGYRPQRDITKKDSFNLLEARLQLKDALDLPVMEDWSPEFEYKAELLADGYDDRLIFRAREAALSFTPHDMIDVKLGRQILTWGTGDYIFINDLFPKDYISFFTGRDDEYLKVPSDALRVSLFFDALSVDAVVIPVMEPDVSVTGKRISFFDGLSGAVAGEDAARDFIEPREKAGNMELALRAYRTVGRTELALYLFRGFYKEPRGIRSAAARELFYPRLHVFGMSARGPVLGGIGSFEMGYYDSRQDRNGRDPLIENPSVKYLLGYTRDLGGETSLGLQYEVEEMLHYASYRAGLMPGDHARDEFRHLLTMRLTKLYRAQTIVTSLFVFFSPSDMDAYIRPSIAYKVTDSWKVTAGANVFLGRDEYTDFGTFRRNDNIYTRIRYIF